MQVYAASLWPGRYGANIICLMDLDVWQSLDPTRNSWVRRQAYQFEFYNFAATLFALLRRSMQAASLNRPRRLFMSTTANGEWISSNLPDCSIGSHKHLSIACDSTEPLATLQAGNLWWTSNMQGAQPEVQSPLTKNIIFCKLNSVTVAMVLGRFCIWRPYPGIWARVHAVCSPRPSLYARRRRLLSFNTTQDHISIQKSQIEGRSQYLKTWAKTLRHSWLRKFNKPRAIWRSLRSILALCPQRPFGWIPIASNMNFRLIM